MGTICGQLKSLPFWIKNVILIITNYKQSLKLNYYCIKIDVI